MARLNFDIGALWVTWMAALSVRPNLLPPSLRGLPPEWIALMLRMTLPVAPKLSDMLVAIQAGAPWHHLVVTMTA